MPLSELGTSPLTREQPVFGRIVCGIDGSLAGQNAAQQAMALAQRGTQVRLVCARDSWGNRDAPRLRGRRADRALAAAQAAARRQQIDCEIEQADSLNPFELLLERAEDADLLVVGSRGRSRATDSALGTTAAMSVHAVGVPVLVARRAPRLVPFPSRILASSDGSPSAEHALSVAAQIAHHADAELTLLSVEPRSRGGETALRDELRQLEAAAGRRVSLVRAVGEPSGQIAAAAKSERAALVVTGGRDPAGIDPIESISARVAHQASCSVLIAR